MVSDPKPTNHSGTKNGKPTETDISFYITIRRKTLFYTVNLILPTLLISFLCILVFYLPAEAGQLLYRSLYQKLSYVLIHHFASRAGVSFFPCLCLHSMSFGFPCLWLLSRCSWFLPRLLEYSYDQIAFYFDLCYFRPVILVISISFSRCDFSIDFLTRLLSFDLSRNLLSGEKVTLGISILLSLVVFLLLVSKILPPTSLVLPLIAKYLLFTFLMNCISILATVIIINWNFRGPRTHKMPNWIRAVFLKYLPVLLFIRRPKKTRLRWMMDMPNLGVHYHPYHPDSSRQPQARQDTSQTPADSYSFGRKTRDLDLNEEGSCLPPPLPSDSRHHHHHQEQHHHHHHLHHVVSPPQTQHHQSSGHSHQDHPSLHREHSHLHHSHQHHSTCNAINAQSSLSPAHLHPSHDLLHRNNSILSDNGIGCGLGPPSGPAMDPMSPGGSSCHSPKDDDSIDTLYLTPEAYRATEAIEFIAEHLRSEDEYIQVSLMSGLNISLRVRKKFTLKSHQETCDILCSLSSLMPLSWCSLSVSS